MGQKSLIAVGSQSYDIGRATIFDGDYWDGTGDFLDSLAHTGNTEGAVEPAPNEEFSMLTIPENLGPAALKVYVTGAAPTFDLGIFPNPALMARLSPTGSASLGNMRQRRVRERSLWIAPEQLFLKPDANGVEQEVEVEQVAGVWTKDGLPFTTEDQRLFNVSLFIWKAFIERLVPKYAHEDGGKALKTVTVHCLHDLTKPDGHQIWTAGVDLASSGIDLDGVTSS